MGLLKKARQFIESIKNDEWRRILSAKHEPIERDGFKLTTESLPVCKAYSAACLPSPACDREAENERRDADRTVLAYRTRVNTN